MSWLKWLKLGVGQAFIFHSTVPNAACLNLIYDTAKKKQSMQRVQRWWDLSKLVTNTLTSLSLVIFSALSDFLPP